jgi:parvulin-like peptidyl-prolyl isomerase
MLASKPRNTYHENDPKNRFPGAQMKCLFLMVLSAIFTPAKAQILATAGTAKITVEDFERRLQDIRRQTTNPPTNGQFLEDLIRFEIGLQEAERLKLQSDPLVKERYKQVLYNSLLEKQVGSKVENIQITENEMKDFYKKNPEIRLAHILIDIKSNATTEERETTRRRAEEILGEVKKSKRPFEQLVKIYSDDTPTKEMGGDIGFQSRVTLMPLIYDTAVNMKPGDIRGLIETRFGFHILKMIERRNYDMADKRQIRAAVFEEKRAKVFNDYFEKLKKTYSVDVHKDVLKSLKD